MVIKIIFIKGRDLFQKKINPITVQVETDLLSHILKH